ncbi:MAG: hypothetical protein WA628_24840 [Terriglobales bacterium]
MPLIDHSHIAWATVKPPLYVSGRSVKGFTETFIRQASERYERTQSGIIA